MTVLRTPRRRRLVASLATLVLVGELVTVGIQGTLGAYTSITTNKTASSASGALTLVTRSPSATGPMCLSYGGSVGSPSANDNPTCTKTVTISGGPFKPGTSTSVTIRLVNTGSVNAGDLSMWATKKCTAGTTAHTLCKFLELTIQQTTSAGTTNVKCYYPATGTTCTATKTKTVSAFSSKYTTGTKLRLTGGLPALGSRFFKVGITFPTVTTPGKTTFNDLQGKTAKFSFGWYVDQTGP